MNLTIDSQNIESSFDRIAKTLLLESGIKINGEVLNITEIEFYYYHDKSHPDKYTHEHNVPAGHWRSHNQGLDISLGYSKNHDGGILIRGVKYGDEYINGPLKSVRKIFELFGESSLVSSISLEKRETENIEILKTFRHLPNKVEYVEFHKKQYRYITHFDNADIPNKLKDEMIKESNTLK